MRKLSYALIALITLAGCGESTKSSDPVVSDNDTTDQKTIDEVPPTVPVDLSKINIPVPKNCTVLDSVCGDLDNDGIDELAVVYNMKEPDSGDGYKRSIVVYKVQEQAWNPIDESKSAVRGSSEGGMMGDPYEEIEIEKGILIIYHSGGSRWKWSDTDKYRYQNNRFELIGYKGSYGAPCDYWQSVDFNLSTGKLNFEREKDDCDEVSEEERADLYPVNETIVRKDVKLILKNRHDKDIEIKLPKSRETIYL